MITALVLTAALTLSPITDASKIPDSTYRDAAYYMPTKEGIRKCIIYRESRGSYRADGSGGSGAYSFIQTTWNHYARLAGFEHMVGVRPNKAPKYVQDAVFWRTWNHGKGKWHWSTRWNPGITECFKEK